MINTRMMLPWITAANAVLMTACGAPSIQSFSAEPRRVCEGDTVMVHWQASGEVRLTTDPEMQIAGSVASTDTVRVAMDERTEFRLDVVGGEDYARQEVLVVTSGQVDTLALRTSPAGDTALVAHDSIPPKKWEDLLRIGTIASLSGRPLTVRHRGREVTLAADTTPSNALQGLKYGGQWKVHAPLVGDERMGDPDNPPPEQFLLLVRHQCQR